LALRCGLSCRRLSSQHLEQVREPVSCDTVRRHAVKSMRESHDAISASDASISANLTGPPPLVGRPSGKTTTGTSRAPGSWMARAIGNCLPASVADPVKMAANKE
jgi:hypothetical protein